MSYIVTTTALGCTGAFATRANFVNPGRPYFETRSVGTMGGKSVSISPLSSAMCRENLLRKSLKRNRNVYEPTLYTYLYTKE